MNTAVPAPEASTRPTLGFRRWAGLAATVGILALGLGALIARGRPQGLHDFSYAYLTSFAFFLTISLGALFFVLLQHLTRAGWSVVVRRLAELLAVNLTYLSPLALVLVVPVLLHRGDLYVWAAPVAALGEAGPNAQAGYLNGPFFTVRLAVYFILWIVLARFYLNRSTRQDASGDISLTSSMQKWSGIAMVGFALTVTLAAFDIVMSLDPTWSSTIFGVYVFAGGAVGFFALLVLVMVALDRKPYLHRLLTAEHYHDVGKLLFAFVFFWGYIAFSQFVLIWYANLPEETRWYRLRFDGGWLLVALALLFVHFILPFAGLLSRSAKRNKVVLAMWAALLLLMHYLDLYWLIVPAGGQSGIPFGALDILCFIGLSGLYTAGFLALGRTRALVAWRDPRLSEAIAFENT